jgi:phenylacetate-coenzyme A ligase PaaK-like adenylate-forming protein
MDEVQRRLFETLRTTERMPFPQLLRYQAKLTENLVRHASERFPFYTERLRPVLRDGVFYPERWSDIPILTRPELQAAMPGIMSTDPGELPGWMTETSTSGSTGMPLRLRWTWLASMATNSMLERLYRWYDFDPNAHFAWIRTTRKSTPRASGDIAIAAPQDERNRAWSIRGPDGISSVLDIATPVAQQIAWLRDLRPQYLTTYPTNLAALAEAAGPNVSAIGLKAVITVGEVLDPEMRRTASNTFGARVVDTYGCQELGKIAIECPQSGLLHICAENMIVEVLDEAGDPVVPGGTGRVVLTGFYNLGSPIIRYAIGDYAETAEAPCPCGCTLPALRRVLGRQRNMFLFNDGSSIWPRSELITSLYDRLPLKQFQVVQTELDHVELRYVPADARHKPDMLAIVAHLRKTLHPSIRVTLVPTTEIPRSAGGKFEDFISLVGRQRARSVPAAEPFELN